jgi:hypothetical protein
VTTETKVEAVAWQQRIRYWPGAPWGEWQTFKSKPDRDASWQPYRGSEWQRETRELADASAITALEGEVECLRVQLAGSQERAMMVLRAKDDWMDRANKAERRVTEPGRYFADGPQGHFFADDLQLARDLVNLYDKNDDWTITDLRNPTGAAPAASGGEDDWHCSFCHCASFARIDERGEDGKFRPGNKRRCLDCKRIHDPEPQPPAGASVSERARELAVSIVRDACETDPADPDHTETISIRRDDLMRIAETAIEHALSSPRQEGGSTAASTQGLRELVQAPLAEYHAMRDSVGGCTDGHCVVKKREGMHTNGGCKCWKTPMTAQRMIRAGRKLADELESLLTSPTTGADGVPLVEKGAGP